MHFDIKNKILKIIKSSFGFQNSEIEITKDDLPTMELFFAKQNITPMLIIGLHNLGLDYLLTDNLIKEKSKSIYDFIQRKSSLEEISLALDISCIPHIPLKGSTIRNLYPEPWMRTSSDIDVLVHEDELDKAIKIIEEKTNFKFYKKEHHDAHLINNQVHLELHFSLLSAIDKLDVILSDPWSYSIKSSESFSYYFTNEFNIVYITTHAAKHFIRNGGIGIRPILDLYVLRNKTYYNEKIVNDLCSEAGILNFYNICCDLIDIWFNGNNHTEITLAFEDLVMSGGVFGSKHLNVVSNKRRYRGENYLTQRIFKTRDEIIVYYPICKKHPILIPFYQFKRWLKVLNINNSKKYYSEIKHANSIEQEEIDKYEMLIKSIGLF